MTTVQQLVAHLLAEVYRPPSKRAPRSVEDGLRAQLTESDANMLVALASDLLCAARGKHTYCYSELADMLPHGHNPDNVQPGVTGTCHGKDNDGLVHNVDGWECYYYGSDAQLGK